MDPLTQGLLGAATAQMCFGHKLPRSAWLIGMTAAMTPDLDVLVTRFTDDPLAVWRYHRQFTHSLIFIPIGGVLAALPFLLFPSLRRAWKWVLAAAVVAFATHAPLDICTSYGTIFLWPFSDVRLSLDVISIIDPLFTLALLLGVIAAAVLKQRRPATIAFTLCMAYLLFGAWQHHRVITAQHMLANSRGHVIERGRAMNTLGNQVLWRSIYESGGTLYADAVRVPVIGATIVRPGEAVKKVTSPRVNDDDEHAPVVREAFDVFYWFADGYVAAVSDYPQVFGDMRYSSRAEAFEPLWGMMVTPAVEGRPFRLVGFGSERKKALQALWRELIDGTSAGVTLAELQAAPKR